MVTGERGTVNSTEKFMNLGIRSSDDGPCKMTAIFYKK